MEQRITLVQAVRRRKSTRSYDMKGLAKEQLSHIMEYADNIPLLIPRMKIKAELIGANDVKSITKWRAPHYLSLYAEGNDAGLILYIARNKGCLKNGWLHKIVLT